MFTEIKEFVFIVIIIKVLECEYHVFFECEKITEIRANFLYNWYTSSCSEANFYYLLQSTNPNIIRHLAHYIYIYIYISYEMINI